MTTQQLQTAENNRKRYEDLTVHLHYIPRAEDVKRMVLHFANVTNGLDLRKEFISIDELLLVYRARINAEIERLENEFNAI